MDGNMLDATLGPSTASAAAAAALPPRIASCNTQKHRHGRLDEWQISKTSALHGLPGSGLRKPGED
jgi:hypothetical protein